MRRVRLKEKRKIIFLPRSRRRANHTSPQTTSEVLYTPRATSTHAACAQSAAFKIHIELHALANVPCTYMTLTPVLQRLRRSRWRVTKEERARGDLRRNQLERFLVSRSSNSYHGPARSKLRHRYVQNNTHWPPRSFRGAPSAMRENYLLVSAPWVHTSF